jgi:hypothetical protein
MPEIKVYKPAPGRLVRDPVTGQPLPEQGAPVKLNSHVRRIFYARRVKDGDVTEVKNQAPKINKKEGNK